MNWILCFSLSIAIIALSVGASVLLAAMKYKRGRLITPFNVLFTGAVLAVFLVLLPVYALIVGETRYHTLQTVLFSILNTFQVFTINTDCGIILDNISESATSIAGIYSTYMSVIFVLAPVLTFSFVASFFKNLSAYAGFFTHFFSEAYVFSELNERSLALGRDLKAHHKGAVIVYTDVFGSGDEASFELEEQARELGAVCFKKDILTINFKLHHAGTSITFFTIGADESENIDQSLKLISAYQTRENTQLFVFSTRIESELLLTNAAKGSVKVRRINEVRSLVNRILYEEGERIFENARPSASGKRIGAVVVGMGRHGTEMLKALAWYCQMDGYQIFIDAFDRDPLAEEKFSALCPELMSDAYNGVSVPGESEYTISIHSGLDVQTKSFADQILKLKEATYVLVALGSDEENIKTAVNLRMLFERCGAKPVIQAIVYSTDEKNALKDIRNYRGQAYQIDFIGDMESSYSEDVIIDSAVESDALQRHLKWGREEEFWQYEYNYRSSVASAIHRKARIACGIPGADKREEELTPEERDTIEQLEHRRWNAYMRSEGYVYSGSPDKSSRNDLGKMHHDLVDFSSLTEEEKRKDSRVGAQ